MPRFAGTISWKQYRQVFDAIALSKRMGRGDRSIVAALSFGGGCIECALNANRTGGCADHTLWFAGTTGGLSAKI